MSDYRLRRELSVEEMDVISVVCMICMKRINGNMSLNNDMWKAIQMVPLID